MDPKIEINRAYDLVQESLPRDIVSELKFLNPSPHSKGDTRIMRGRILGKSRNRIWDTKSCFYEIGIGSYEAARVRTGGIGFLCYPNFVECGGGIHQIAVSDFLVAIVKNNSQFQTSESHESFRSAFNYFKPSEEGQFPTELAAQNLTELIKFTFLKLNNLGV